MTMPTQTLSHRLNDLRMHDAAFEGLAGPRVMEDRTSGRDHDPGGIDGPQRLKRFRPGSTGRHDDFDARVPRSLDRLTISPRHPLTSEQGAVQINGKQLGRHRYLDHSGDRKEGR